MITPLRCEERGGDQERVSVREVMVDTGFCGGAPGTIQHSYIKHIKQDFYVHVCSLSCLVVTLVVAAGPPPTLV